MVFQRGAQQLNELWAAFRVVENQEERPLQGQETSQRCRRGLVVDETSDPLFLAKSRAPFNKQTALAAAARTGEQHGAEWLIALDPSVQDVKFVPANFVGELNRLVAWIEQRARVVAAGREVNNICF